ncbi:MAG: CPBP family glutamic-type intramembrane protease [Hadesarchaea archaeon]|nr:CPBP family glutamic-type intramembrane protease [Hadesarchaea archaeon]
MGGTTLVERGELARALFKAALVLLPLCSPFLLAGAIRVLGIERLMELGIDDALTFLGMTLLGLYAVLELTDRRALVRRRSAREFVAGTATLACADLLGLLAAKLILLEGAVASSGGFGLGFLWLAVVVGPLIEEWSFRHLLISGLRRLGRRLGRRPSRYACVAASALIFGFAHLFDPIIGRSLQHIPPIAYSGAIYGLGYVEYGLASAILLHALGNLSVALLL